MKTSASLSLYALACTAAAWSAPTVVRAFQQQQQQLRQQRRRSTRSHVSASRYGTAMSASSVASAPSDNAEELRRQKSRLLELIGSKRTQDAVLMDPFTKEPLTLSASGVILAGDNRAGDVPYTVRSPTNTFRGSSGSFIDLLQVASDGDDDRKENGSAAKNTDNGIAQQILPLVPVNLRSQLSRFLGDSAEVIPMRDLFRSPAVSFAYERGWRQNFATAGFPGPDIEAKMAMDYFAPALEGVAEKDSVVVDMSCATGLFTRRFVESGRYGRVLGCDYSESMLAEARRRIRAMPASDYTRLDLVRLDVGNIPMQDGSVDCLHAGAAMHCWPELDKAASEIYRVLKPNGGRYFATTFLQSYFRALQSTDPNAGASGMGPSRQAFQYFTSTDTLRDLMVRGGFEPDKVQIEVLGAACVVIRCEK